MTGSPRAPGRAAAWRRALLLGAAIGAAAGALFALAVVSLADCAGPRCGYERVVGVLGHAAAGGAAGLLVGALLRLGADAFARGAGRR